MDLRTPSGGLVNVGEKHLDRLLALGYTKVDKNSSEDASEASDEDWHTPGTEGPVQDAPALPEGQEDTKDELPPAAEVRAWAVENEVPVPAKGRVPAEVYEKYAAAHQK